MKIFYRQFLYLTLSVSFFLLSSFFFTSYAQLTVTQGGTATAMAQAIVGPGVIVSNATLNCPTASYGTFSGNSNVGLTNGIMLTSGNITQVPGSAATQLDFDNGTSGGDPDLVAIEPQATYNTCILEFDIIPICDTLQLTYVFASEEYPEFVCSGFNDVFGFFITGPNPSGGNYTSQNIALIPGTNIAVAINSINPGVNGTNGTPGGCTSLAYSSLYTNNSSGTTITYDAFTVPLIASVPVTTCQSYHLKLAIADAGDQWYDSGVFLEQSGLTCPGTSVSVVAIADSATEGCVNGQIQIIRGGDLTSSLNVTLTFTGTATNGSDYTLTNSVTFGTGQSSITLNIPALADGNAEGTEIATITASYSICGTTASSNSVNISILEPLTMSFSSVNPGCGGSTGTITANPVGGTNPYTYSWSNGQTTQTATGLTAGSYSVTITDANNCVNDSSFTINTTPSLTLSTSSTAVACNGGSNGTATVSASSGVTPYTYLWNTSPAQTASTATGLTAGNYTVTVNDNGGCQNTATVAVNSQSPMTLSTSSTAVTCQGGNNGTASVTASGGNTPYTYSWSNGVETQNLASLQAGNYSVTVTDVNICSSVTTVTVTDGAPNANASISPVGPFCNNASTLNLSAVSPGGIWSGTGITNTSTGAFDPATAGAGTHTIIYSISSACGDTDTVSIVVNAVPNATINPVSSLCTNDSPITLSAATSGGTFSGTGVSGTSFNPSVSGAGTFTITYNITVNGCSSSDTETITVNQSQDATISAVAPLCLSSSPINLTAVSPGGNWTGNGITNSSTGTFDASVAGTGSHIITYSINLACGDTDTVSISVSTVNLSLNSDAVNINCNGLCNGYASVTASNGITPFTFSWNDPSSSANDFAANLCAGTYQCIVTSAVGCKDTVQVSITQPAPILITPFATFNSTCYGYCDGYGITIPSGGTQPYIYNWSNGDTLATAGNLCAGNFSFTLTDGNGCTHDTAFSIDEPLPIVIAASGVQTNCAASCYGSATVTVVFGQNTPFTYQWDNNTGSQIAATATALCSGNYIVTATDNTGCSAITSVVVSQPTPVSVSVSQSDTICIGQNATISVTNTTGGAGSYTYLWSNGIITSSQTVPSVQTCYSVTATDGNGCESPAQTVCMDVFPPVDVTALFDQTICPGGAANLSAFSFGGNGTIPTYSWYTGTGQNVGTGAVITENPNGNYPNTINYWVIADDGCSPKDTDSVVVNFSYVPQPIINPVAPSCAPYFATLSADTMSNVASCVWNLGDGNIFQGCGPLSYTYSDAGNYSISLTIVTNEGCPPVTSSPVLVVVNDNPLAGFSYLPAEPTIINTFVNFTNASQGQIVEWDWTFFNTSNSPIGTSSDINPAYTFPSDTGLYPVNLIVTNSSGCVDDTTLYIYVDNEYSIYIPNAFTPNGDGDNDFFPPIGLGINPNKFKLYIFDRWGDLIFESHDLNDRWDGTARELGGTEIVKQDLYVWKIETEEATKERKPHQYTGQVTLLKGKE